MKQAKISIEHSDLKDYLNSQLNNFFPDKTSCKEQIDQVFDEAFERCLNCFSQINLKHYSDENIVYFNHLNGDHYTSFLYFISNTAYNVGLENLYVKASLLNKALHGIDLFGHVKMPDVFLLVHPIGTVIGRATFADRIVIYQNVTIGGKRDKNGGINYPKFSENTILFANTIVIGSSILKENTTLGARTFISDLVVNEPNKIILGAHPNNVIKSDLKFQNFFY